MANRYLGTCNAKIEIAGPTMPDQLTIGHPDLVSMTEWIVAECVVRMAGMGGFGTLGIQNLVNTVLNWPTLPSARDVYRESV